MLPCFKLNKIPKKDVFDSKKFLVIFTVILYSTTLTSILSCVRGVSEQTYKVTCFSYVVFLFFPVKWYYLVFTGHVFSPFRGFYQKNIVMPGSPISLYIDKKEKTLFTCEPNFTARRPFLAEKRIKTFFFSLITMAITVEMSGRCKTCCTFCF